MKDMWGKTAYVGVQFVHPLRRGSSLWMNKYIIVSITEDTETYKGTITARQVSPKDSWAYKVWDGSTYRDMTDEERAKVNSKTVTIYTFSDRSTIL